MNAQRNADDRTGRIHSLDGLRGVACLAVLLFHVGLMIQPFGPDLPYYYVPANAAVMVFYVLSGVVLSLSPLKKRSYDWFAYYPRRIVRLCVPLLAAIVLGVVGGFVAYHLGASSRSALAVDYSGNPADIAHDILMQFDILFNVSDGMVTLYGEPLMRVNSPVWSMSWELWFSLALPLCIFLALLFKRDRAPLVVLIACIFGAHFTGYFPLRFAIMFLLGVLIAKHYEAFSQKRLPKPLELLVLILCLALIELPQLGEHGTLYDATVHTLMNAACAGLVFLVLSNGLLRRALSTRPCQWLGKISYSMYLTNAVVIGCLQTLLPSFGIPGPAQALIALAASFLFAWIFWYCIERPSITWSHRVGERTATLERPL